MVAERWARGAGVVIRRDGIGPGTSAGSGESGSRSIGPTYAGVTLLPLTTPKLGRASFLTPILAHEIPYNGACFHTYFDLLSAHPLTLPLSIGLVLSVLSCQQKRRVCVLLTGYPERTDRAPLP